jgi:fumarylacetoacetase
MTWVEGAAGSGYDVEHLPYGVVSHERGHREIAVRIGDQALSLRRLHDAGLLDEVLLHATDVFDRCTLDHLLARGPEAWAAVRSRLQSILTDGARAPMASKALLPLAEVETHLPWSVADYVDFYSSEHHATNVGRILRPDGEALTPNWKHLPIGYHGRSGTIVVSGTDIVRPSGQRRPPTEPQPVFGPSVRLDIEAELGFVVGSATRLGEPVPLADADEHLFGVVLLNDWSARDLQAWEYVPLGPFLGKSFATSISPWVVTTEALRAARVPLPGQDPEPLPYLRGEPTVDGAGTAYGLDVHLEVDWNGTVVSRPQFRDMYWSPAQMLAHMTVNGATLRDGDLFGSGTISGPQKETRGCFLELSWSGTEPVTLDDGTRRTFLEDGDTVTLRATAPGPDGGVIGLGECVGTVRPAR